MTQKEKDLRVTLRGLYEISCCVHSELGKMIPSGMMGSKRLKDIRDALLEKIGAAEKELSV